MCESHPTEVMEGLWGESWRCTLYLKQSANRAGQRPMSQNTEILALEICWNASPEDVGIQKITRNIIKLSLFVFKCSILLELGVGALAVGTLRCPGEVTRQDACDTELQAGLQLFNLEGSTHLSFVSLCRAIDFSLWEEGTVRPQCVIRQTPWSYYTWTNCIRVTWIQWTPGICWQNTDAMTPSTGIDDSNSDATRLRKLKQRDGLVLVGCRRMCVLGEDSRGERYIPWFLWHKSRSMSSLGTITECGC